MKKIYPLLKGLAIIFFCCISTNSFAQPCEGAAGGFTYVEARVTYEPGSATVCFFVDEDDAMTRFADDFMNFDFTLTQSYSGDCSDVTSMGSIMYDTQASFPDGPSQCWQLVDGNSECLTFDFPSFDDCEYDCISIDFVRDYQCSDVYGNPSTSGDGFALHEFALHYWGGLFETGVRYTPSAGVVQPDEYDGFSNFSDPYGFSCNDAAVIEFECLVEPVDQDNFCQGMDGVLTSVEATVSCVAPGTASVCFSVDDEDAMIPFANDFMNFDFTLTQSYSGDCADETFDGSIMYDTQATLEGPTQCWQLVDGNSECVTFTFPSFENCAYDCLSIDFVRTYQCSNSLGFPPATPGVGYATHEFALHYSGGATESGVRYTPNAGVVQPNDDGFFIVNDPFGTSCSDAASIELECKAPPLPEVECHVYDHTAGTGWQLDEDCFYAACIGSHVCISVSLVNGDISDYHFSWTYQGDVIGEGLAVDLIGAGTYTVTLTDANGNSADYDFNYDVLCCYPVDGGITDFEDGWQMWNDGGVNSWWSKYFASAIIQQEGYFYSDPFDLSNMTDASISFEMTAFNMDEKSDGLVLELSADGGKSFKKLSHLQYEVDFRNREKIPFKITVPDTYSNKVVFRFRSNTSEKNEQFRFNSIDIRACRASSKNAGGNLDTTEISKLEVRYDDRSVWFVTDPLTSGESLDYRIYNLNGALLFESQTQDSTWSLGDISLHSGVYLIVTKTSTEKFVIK